MNTFNSTRINLAGFTRGTSVQIERTFGLFLDNKFPKQWNIVVDLQSNVVMPLGVDGGPRIIEIYLFNKGLVMKGSTGVSLADLLKDIEKEINDWILSTYGNPVIVQAPQFFYWQDYTKK